MAVSSWEEFFESLSQFATLSSVYRDNRRSDLIEYAITRCESFLRVLYAIYSTIETELGESAVLHSIRDLTGWLQQIKSLLNESYDGLPDIQSGTAISVDTSSRGQRGRPKVLISRLYTIGPRELGFSWTKVSSILGISRRTLYSHRQEQGLVGESDPFALSDLTDEQLDQTVQDIKAQMPYIGIQLVHGALRARGIRVPQYRVRECLHRVDPINSALRWPCFTSNLLCARSKLPLAHGWES